MGMEMEMGEDGRGWERGKNVAYSGDGKQESWILDPPSLVLAWRN